MKTIGIIVDAKGASRLQTKGFSGPECREASAPLERALGIATDDKPTAEFYESEPARQQQATRPG